MNVEAGVNVIPSRLRRYPLPMSFQAYLDTIKAKTGLDPADFRRLAEERGLLAEGVKVTQIVDWLKEDFGLGRGHAMAIVNIFQDRPAREERLEKQFTGTKAHWRATFDALLATLGKHGPVGTAATDTYVSLLKGKAKFAIVAMTADRLDIGIKLKDAAPTDRFEPAGSWNVMVTHRVRLVDAAQIDAELLGWLERAYDAA
ncbi:MAG: hypothetical protein JWP19_1090 [Rhodoglobus sp.]|nr:hypothetical protein [Rhodoglobus sp.]